MPDNATPKEVSSQEPDDEFLVRKKERPGRNKYSNRNMKMKVSRKG